MDITGEVLGKGGFGTVYLADFTGRNAAAKVVMYQDGLDDCESDDDDCGDGGQPPDPAAGDAAAISGGDRAKEPPSPRQQPPSEENRQQRKAFMRELEAMKRLRGAHTVTTYGAVTSLPDRLVLVSQKSTP